MKQFPPPAGRIGIRSSLDRSPQYRSQPQISDTGVQVAIEIRLHTGGRGRTGSNRNTATYWVVSFLLRFRQSFRIFYKYSYKKMKDLFYLNKELFNDIILQ